MSRNDAFHMQMKERYIVKHIFFLPRVPRFYDLLVVFAAIQRCQVTGKTVWCCLTVFLSYSSLQFVIISVVSL